VVSEGSGQKISRHLNPEREEIRQDAKNVRMVVKFIESEGKGLQEKAVVDPGQVEQKCTVLVFMGLYKLKGQMGKIWVVFAGWATVIDRFD
jgi:hypothetical protein